MTKLKTATGREIDCSFFVCSEVDGDAHMSLRLSMLEAVTIFSNPIETVQLYFDDVYIAHFTKLHSISADGDFVRIWMKRS